MQRSKKREKEAENCYFCVFAVWVCSASLAWSRMKKERRRDTHRTLEREELSKQKDSSLECMRAMCFLLGVWYLVTD